MSAKGAARLLAEYLKDQLYDKDQTADYLEARKEELGLTKRRKYRVLQAVFPETTPCSQGTDSSGAADAQSEWVVQGGSCRETIPWQSLKTNLPAVQPGSPVPRWVETRARSPSVKPTATKPFEPEPGAVCPRSCLRERSRRPLPKAHAHATFVFGLASGASTLKPKSRHRVIGRAPEDRLHPLRQELWTSEENRTTASGALAEGWLQGQAGGSLLHLE